MSKRRLQQLRPLAALVLLALAACNPSGGKSTANILDSADGKDWASYGRTYGQQHFSPLDQINGETASRLGLAWSADLPSGNMVTQPIAVDGVVYMATGYSVVRAFDGATGKLLWEYDPEVYKTAGAKFRAGWGSRGIGWWNGKVYTVTSDGRAIGIDAKTGKKVWETPIFQDVDEDATAYVTGAPFMFGGKLIIGNAADFGPARGRVTALDAETGKLAWKFYTVPGDPKKGFENDAMKMAAATWSGEWWKFGGNGSPWNAFAYDPETKSVFVGTGNGSPYSHVDRSEGKGDNLFLASIVALDVDTGRYKWHYQQNPGETWDFTATQDIELADITLDGQPRKVLMTAPKNGFYYIIDRTNGKLLSAKPFTKVNWASSIDLKTGRPVEHPKARVFDGTFKIMPATYGGHNWQTMAYSPKTGLAYMPATNVQASYTSQNVKEAPPARDVAMWGGLNMNFNLTGPDKVEMETALIAWDPIAQKEVWRAPAPRAVPVGAMATGGDLVFQGAIDATFSAYDAKTGKKVWSFDAQAPALSSAITYEAGGKQYVTVLVGMGTSPSMFGQLYSRYKYDYRTMPRRVLTFALDSKGALPAKVEADLSKPADPGYKKNPEQELRGAVLFNTRCNACHGLFVVAGGMAPDLRRSSIPLDKDAFYSVVHDGALMANGMPNFDLFTKEQIEDMRQYIRAEAHNPMRDKETNTLGGGF